ncbi:hypothetical protein [Phenylobacterium sp.]|uniref:hypothetical protein n=1 Tax=Phenylobacterium sp. TaxID=1871053 RepID=UPI0035682D9A
MILGVGLLCAGCGQVADAQAKLVENLRIKTAISDYEQAVRSGPPLDRCVKAKMVAIAYSDAKDVADGQAWAAREREDCQAAAAALHVVPPSRTAGP